MEEKKRCFEGKKANLFIANLILSLICFAGCIVALVIDSGYKGANNGGFETFIVFDLIAIVVAVVAMFFPGKAAFGSYICGTIFSFIAFCIILEELDYYELILLQFFQVVCVILTYFMRITIVLEDEFLSAVDEKSKTSIPYESIDYLNRGIFSKVTFKSAAGGISCILVNGVEILFSQVYEKRKTRLASYSQGPANYTQSSVIEELPEL